MTRKGMAPTLTNPRHVLQSAQQYNSGNAAHEINGSVCRVCADRRIRRLSGRPYRGTVVDERELAGVSCLFLPGILDCLDICGPADGTQDCLTAVRFFSEPPTRLTRFPLFEASPMRLAPMEECHDCSTFYRPKAN